jgi:hypothetical protein
MQTTEGTKINTEATIVLDNVASKVHYKDVPSSTDVERMMHQRLKHECVSLKSTRDEIEQLADSYNRYVDLKSEADNRGDRIRRFMAILGPDSLDGLGTDDVQEEIERQGEPEALREELPLWRAIEEYLIIVAGEAKVGDVQDFFSAMTYQVTRQAIESALRSHSDTFRVVKRGRDKYISLKKQRA